MFMPCGVPRGHGSVVAHVTPARWSVCSSSATGTGREREDKDAQLHERPFAAGQHAHGHPVGCGVPVELSPIEELMEERGVAVDHATIPRGVVQDSPLLEAVFHRWKRSVWARWRMDETSIKVRLLLDSRVVCDE